MNAFDQSRRGLGGAADRRQRAQPAARAEAAREAEVIR
jgi:hypothetical protein